MDYSLTINLSLKSFSSHWREERVLSNFRFTDAIMFVPLHFRFLLCSLFLSWKDLLLNVLKRWGYNAFDGNVDEFRRSEGCSSEPRWQKRQRLNSRLFIPFVSACFTGKNVTPPQKKNYEFNKIRTQTNMYALILSARSYIYI